MKQPCEWVASWLTTLPELPPSAEEAARNAEDGRAPIPPAPTPIPGATAPRTDIQEACACLRAELEAWWSGVIIRPMPQRGLTSWQVLYFEPGPGRTIILPADPMRRMFCVMAGPNQWHISPFPETLDLGYGWVTNGQNNPYIFDDEHWGPVVQAAWWMDNFFVGAKMGILVDRYVQAQPGGRS